MKFFKKLMSAVATVAMTATMLLGSGIPAFAEESDQTYTLTITNTGKTAHTLELYQIFTGDLLETTGEDGTVSRTLSNIEWGSGISADSLSDLGDASEKAAAVAESGDAAAFAEELQGKLGTASQTTTVEAGASYTFEGLAAGYYLVKDAAESQNGVEDGATTSYIVQVVGDVQQDTKLDVPTVVKKVQDVNDTTGETTGWQDSADYDIGDEIPYEITGTMPSNIDDYETYYYQFSDTMTKGLAYTAKNYTVKIDGNPVTSSFTEDVKNNEDGSTTVTWTCKDVKALGATKDSKIVVDYKCTLDEDAVVGAAGNPNTVFLTYSNNPNKGGEGETGHTPTDKNIVFTYKVIVNKVDPEGKPLAGAEFTLSKVNDDETRTVIKTFTITGNDEQNPTTFTASGLDDGTYVLEETKTPDGYNTIKPQYFTITADHDVEADDPKLNNLNGTAIKDPSGLAAVIKFTADTDAGSLSTNVVNKKGTVLPTTGGMGTTIFYIAGAVLVIAAAVIMISRKRMSASED